MIEPQPAADAAPHPIQAPTPARRRFHKGIGAGAGLLAAALLLGIAGGAAWGALRPTFVVEVIDGVPIVDQDASSPNAAFAGVGWFTLLAALLGVVLAVIAWGQTRAGRARGGPLYLLWLAICAAAATFAALVTGETIAGMLHRADPSRVAPPVTESVVWLVAPFIAAFAFWMCSAVAYAATADGPPRAH